MWATGTSPTHSQMSKAFKFLVTRRSIIEEGWWVEADTEEEALEAAYDGEVDNRDCDRREWIDYDSDEWVVDDCEDLCPLVKMIKEYDAQTG